MSGSKQTGTWTYWHANGNQQARGDWKNDDQVGPWVYWYDNGTVKQRGAYDKGFRTGTWDYFYSNSTRSITGAYERDRQIGIWQYFDEAGKPVRTGTFHRGLQHGWWWSEETAGAWWHGIPVGPHFQDGTWKIAGKPSDDAIVVSAGNSDEAQDWQRGSALQAKQATHLQPEPGQETLVVQRTADNAVICVTTQHTDKATTTGFAGLFHAEGRPLAAGPLANYQPSGTWTYWHPNGALAAEINYRTGTPQATRIGQQDGTTSTPNPGDPLPHSVLTLTTAANHAVASTRTVPKPSKGTPEAPKTDEPQSATPEPTVLASSAPKPVVQSLPLTPYAEVPSVFSKAEIAKVAKLIANYTVYTPESSIYSDPEKRNLAEQYHGTRIPHQRLFKSDGTVLDLASYHDNKNVALIIMRGFSGQICIYCSTQTAALADQLNDFNKLDTEVIVVYPGPVETVGPFLDAVRSIGGDTSGLTIALDVNLQLVDSLNIHRELAAPTSLLIDKTGTVFWAYVGKNMGDRPGINELKDAIIQHAK